jgi:hypothetical protein
MSNDQTNRKARGGTKSCIECKYRNRGELLSPACSSLTLEAGRRRKVRCIRTPSDANICRRCEERGSECVAQTCSSQPLHSQRLSSRHRISTLESKVASLSEIIRDIETRLGNPPSGVSELTPALAVSSSEIYESEDNSSMSDGFATEPASHMRSLFQNAWLSVDTDRDRHNEPPRNRKAKASAHLLDLARHALQKLIPPKHEVSRIVRSASRWLDLLHTLLPQPFAAKSQEDILDCYVEMRKPDIDVISLATWLITVAITAQQIPQEHDGPHNPLDGHQNYSRFSRLVSEIVENTLVSDDRLICTVEGLGMAMHFVRL